MPPEAEARTETFRLVRLSSAWRDEFRVVEEERARRVKVMSNFGAHCFKAPEYTGRQTMHPEKNKSTNKG